MKAIPTLIILVSFSLQLLGSTPPFEFGSMTASEMDLEYYREKYPGEPAIVIGDVADCRFSYETDRGFLFNLNREVRIMILTEAGLDYGNFSIPYYESRGGQEEIRRFRAHVYNLDGNRVNRTRVREREGFTQERQNNWKELTFAFPEVKVGSVIEVRYTLISDFLFHLRDWRFQREIPVLHSEYSLNLPSFFVYYARYGGLIELDIQEQENSSDNWRITRKVRTIMGEVDGDTYNVNARSTKFRWAAFNVPPMRPEPFTDNIRNYQARLFFEFTSEQWPDEEPKLIQTGAWSHISRNQWPDEEPKHYTTTWNDVGKYLENHDDFGKFLNESSSALWSLLPEKTPQSQEEKLWTALEIIHSNVRWNEDAAFLTDNTPAEVLKNGTGNSAEVNLLLVSMLRNLGLKSYPVAVSTVSNGSLFGDSPTITQWNYVVALVKMPEGGEVLLDATAQKPIPGFLPQRAINGRGRTIDPVYNNWVNLETNIDHLEQSNYNLKLHDDGTIKGTFVIEVGSFGKYNSIQKIISMGEEEFWNYRFSDAAIYLTNKTINYDVKDGRPLIMSAEISIPGYAQKIGDEMIIPARLFEAIDENIFMSEERLYPVFFKNTLNLVTILNFELPENMILSFRPEEKTGRWRSFTYGLSVNETDKGFQVIWKNIRRNRIVQPPQYSDLRTYYSRMINDNLESIIVRVKNTNDANTYHINE